MMRRGMHPWRKVAGVPMIRPGRDGQVDVWVLRLECGHTLDRPVKFRASQTRVDVLPPPVKVRCQSCAPSR